MNYVVFESGSRAGFSAEMFFRVWKNRHKDNDAKLILSDIDMYFSELPTTPRCRATERLAGHCKTVIK